MKPESYLEFLRERTQVVTGAPPGRLPAHLRDGLVQETLDRLGSAGREPDMRTFIEERVDLAVSGGVDLLMVGQLVRLQRDIEIAVTDHAQNRVVRPPVIGHLPTGQLTAVTTRVPANPDDHLVLFHDQLSRLLRVMGTAVGSAMSRDQSVDRANRRMSITMDMTTLPGYLDAHPEIGAAFAATVLQCASGTPIREAPAPGEEQDYLPLLLTDCSYSFVLGHEYAHIMHGHLATAAVRDDTLARVVDVQKLEYSWRQELDADALGLILALSAGTTQAGWDLPSTFMGINFFFDAVETMDRAVSLLDTGDENTVQLGSHPPSSMRRRLMRSTLQKLGELPSYAANVEWALKLDTMRSGVVEHLWQHFARPAIQRAGATGSTAARSWQAVPRETAEDPSP